MTGKKNISLIYLLAAFFAVSFLSGCSSSKLIDVWKDPSFKQGPINNFLVIAVNNNKTKRRIWEKSFVDELAGRGLKAVPSFQYYPEGAPDENQIPELFKNRYGGIIMIRKVSEEIKKYRVPGSFYFEPWGFRRWYGWAYSRVYMTPGYIDRERVTELEISVWEPGEEGKMIWSAITETVNSDLPKNFSKEISTLVIPEMIKDRILSLRIRSSRNLDSSF